MRAKFSIIAISTLLIVLLIINTINEGFDVAKFLGTIVVVLFLIWIDRKLDSNKSERQRTMNK